MSETVGALIGAVVGWSMGMIAWYIIAEVRFRREMRRKDDEFHQEMREKNEAMWKQIEDAYPEWYAANAKRLESRA